MYLRGRGRVAGLSTAIGGKSSASDIVFHAGRGVWTPRRVRCHFLHMTTRVIVCGDGTHLQNVFLVGFYMGVLTVIRVEQFEVFLLGHYSPQVRADSFSTP